MHESLERRTLLSAVPQGPEFPVNVFTTGNQINSQLAMDNAGNFVVVWQSAGQDGSGDGVFMRRYTAAGVAIDLDDVQVNQFTTGNQQSATVAMDSDGDFVIAWTSAAQDGVGAEIWARRFASSGAPAGDEFHVNQTTTGQQLTPAVAMDGAGNFVVAWVSPFNSYDVYARRYNASGTALSEEFIVNTQGVGGQLSPAVAMDTDGDFVIVWQSPVPPPPKPDPPTEQGNGIFGQRFDQTGAPVGGEFKVNQFTTSEQRSPVVAMDSTGNFVVAWESNTQDGAGYGVYARRYSATVVPLGDEFRVNSTTADQQRSAAIAMDDSGDFAIAWASRLQDGSLYGIYAQCYDAAGTTVGTEFRVNTHTTSTQFNPSMAMDADGDFVVAWHGDQQDGSNFGVFAQRYGSAGGGATVISSAFVWQNAPQRLEIRFSADVGASLDPSDVQILHHDSGDTIPSNLIAVSWNPATNTGAFTFPGYPFGALPDGFFRATLLASGTTPPLAANHVVDFDFLMADANDDNVVNLRDFNILAANFGQSGRDFTLGNFNYDLAGAVNLQDFNLLASRFGKMITPPPPGTEASTAGALVSGARLGTGAAAQGDEDERSRMIGVVG